MGIILGILMVASQCSGIMVNNLRIIKHNSYRNNSYCSSHAYLH